MQSISLIIQIFLVLAFGYFLGPKLSLNIRHFIFKILPYFSYILLTSVALELTLALDQIDNPSTILPPALLIALTTSLGSFFTCLFAYTIFDKESVKGKISLQLFMNALKNIAKAFLALTIGVILGILLTQLHTHIPFNSWYLLLLFIFLIGIELAFTHFNRTWLSWKILIVPLAAFIGSCLAGLLNYSLLGHEFTLNEILALGQGYGWYSMSGILFTQLHSAELGGIALLTDLFR
ncbi:LysO family transporter, partial [Acinetobacter baumannii]|nr:LysO family transporter [Acinetobacter baumannii]